MFIKSICFISLYLLIYQTHAQILSGSVKNQKNEGIEGAIIYFLNSENGTQSDHEGKFVLARNPNQDTILVSYLGFATDTIVLNKGQLNLNLILKEGVQLDEISINSSRPSHSFSLLNPLNVETLSSKEFRKAACCSLAESFQTSNAIDLSYNNAVVSNREIQFLGLRGAYTQQLIENRPVFTGILNTFGFDMIPGTWLSEVNILKGAGSAIYGAQSITGAINTKLVDPESDVPYYLNLYGDYHGRMEGNLHINRKFSSQMQSGIYMHASRHSGFRDHNKDGFYDDARATRLNAMIRNHYASKNWEGQLTLQALRDTRNGGQKITENPYLSAQTINHINLSSKIGYLGFTNPNKSIGSIWDFSYSKLDGSYGKKFGLNAFEYHGLGQIIFSWNSTSTHHKFDFGPVANINYARENLISLSDTNKVLYNQLTGGVFLDYQLKLGHVGECELDRLVLTFSQRMERIEPKKMFWSPRVSARINISEVVTLRASIGRGYRFYRLYSDQINLFSSNKSWNIINTPKYESSWNTGANLVAKPTLFNKELEINFDAYLTWFDQQLIIDLEQNLPENPIVTIFSLNGKSRTGILGATISYPIIDQFTLKVGSRLQSNKVQFIKDYKDQIFIPKWRGMASLDWESGQKKWLWNFTTQVVGPMRFPDKINYPHELSHNREGWSKPYLLAQTQLNYKIKKIDFYIGCDNLTNFTQHDAIIAADSPHSNYFNAVEVFAPINGIKPYIGFKWSFLRNL
ncbi:MAG TPA: TonB-dependent receptor [Saprospiraceae bacterium]|nr:TonB-dependent receptor [Saprospiraceae bacterium]